MPYIIPIACASAITPAYSYKGTELNRSTAEDFVYQPVFVTVLPTSGATHVLLSCFNDDDRSIQYIDELNELANLPLEKALTSILIGEVENTFISPTLYDTLSRKQKRQVLNELRMTIPQEQPLIRSFFKSKLNLFDEKFKQSAP